MKHILNDSMSINKTLGLCAPGDIIYLTDGFYNEKVFVSVDNITIIGESQENTIISNHDFYHKIMPDYNECNTFRTYSCYVGSNNVTFSNLTIENSSQPSRKYGQAVALHVDGDNFRCNNVTLRSAQDTLFTGPLPLDLIERHKNFLPNIFRKSNASHQIYDNCKIIGDIDFIFGCAQALFYECDIISIYRNPENGIDGYISAPAHYEDAEYGYLFYKCNLIKEDNVKNVFLARPWRDYGKAAFILCTMDDHINPLGFDKWNNTNRDKTAKFYEYTENVDLSKREPWSNILNKDEAIAYADEFFKIVKFEKN